MKYDSRSTPYGLGTKPPFAVSYSMGILLGGPPVENFNPDEVIGKQHNSGLSARRPTKNKKLKDNNDAITQSEQMWNMDETGFQLQHPPVADVARKGSTS